MRCCGDVCDTDRERPTEQDLIEERFLEQFAALEDGLAHLQLQMRRMSENAGRFGDLARQMRQAAYPADRGKHTTATQADYREDRSSEGE